MIDLTVPVIGAPMAGGPSGPDLVEAVSRAGGLGFLAAGMKTPQTLDEQIRDVRSRKVSFGVNVFLPTPLPVDPKAYRAYAKSLQPEADALGVSLPEEPIEDDDAYREKLDLLLADPVPVVSFTFGLPTTAVVRKLRKAGVVVLITVTSPKEAAKAATLGPDGLVVQSFEAGGHSGTLRPAQPVATLPLPSLLEAVKASTDLPLIGAGGTSGPADVAAALHAGAMAVQVGTMLLRADEAGTSALHRAALADPSRSGTVVTRAFTGRPARALTNTLTSQYSDDAPLGYPAIHHLTSGLRQAAVASGDVERVNLWAGTGFRAATNGPAAEIIARLVDF